MHAQGDRNFKRRDFLSLLEKRALVDGHPPPPPATHILCARAAIKLSTEQGFVYWRSFNKAVEGWALVAQGQTVEGIAELHRGLSGMKQLGFVGAMTIFIGLLADAHEKAGQVAQGLQAIADALALVQQPTSAGAKQNDIG